MAEHEAQRGWRRAGTAILVLAVTFLAFVILRSAFDDAGDAIELDLTTSASVGAGSLAESDIGAEEEPGDAVADGPVADEPEPTALVTAPPTVSGESPAPPAESTSPPPPAHDGTARFVADVSERTLVDQFGSSVYLVADAGWSLVGALDRQEIIRYLDLVTERGYNGVLFNMIEAGFSANLPAAGEPTAGLPFSGELFTSVPNESYWAHVDWVINEMANRGLTAVANPAYAGFIDVHGSGAEMLAASSADMQAFGQFVGARYAETRNVVYQIGGDTTFDPTSDLGQRYAALADGIVAADDTKVMTVMTGPDLWSSAMWSPAWLDFESVYENSSADLDLLDLWDSTSIPLIYGEPAYEGSRFTDSGWSPLYGRRQLYLSFGHGYSGVIPGSCLRWHFEEDPQSVGCTEWGSAGWPETLIDRSGSAGPDDAPADQHAADTQRFMELVRMLPWPSMVPDTSGVLLIGGRGSGVDRAAARFGSGVGFVYVPGEQEITVDTTVIGPHVQLRWLDPTTGSSRPVAEETAMTERTIPHPGPNAAGDPDWALVVESAS